MHATLPFLLETEFPALRRGPLETLQVNLGYRCNQSCLHCHVNAGPGRKEVMTAATVAAVIHFIDSSRIRTLDLTGGAPELNPHFRTLVAAGRERGIEVIDRCNLTVLQEPGQEETAEFLSENQVKIVASLPCYIQDNVDKQRGDGVFVKSLEALQRLNRLGYGQPDSALQLDLVFNPQGPVLPPPQLALEQEYRRHLGAEYGVVFNRLLTLVNMPIKRFGSTLVSKGQFAGYMALLRAAHRDENLAGVMCRSLVSIDWRGYVYDCDFNQMLGMPTRIDHRLRLYIADLADEELYNNPVRVGDHCYGCTAGQGSSCGGALEI